MSGRTKKVRITEVQRKRMKQALEAWMSKLCSTRPAARKSAERAVRDVYHSSYERPPKLIKWVDSPFAAMVMAAGYSNVDEFQYSLVSSSSTSSYVHYLSLPELSDFWERLAELMHQSISYRLTDALKAAIHNRFGLFWRQRSDAPFFLDIMKAYATCRATDDEPSVNLQANILLANSCGGRLFFSDVAILIERPVKVLLDDEGRLHSEVGPAIRYSDGWGVYAWHGVIVSGRIIDCPITVRQIETEQNTEIRRIMLEKYGVENYLRDAGAHVVMQDECGELIEQQLPDGLLIKMVRVINSTPELDGSSKEYMLRVPPQMRTPREAVAWTFGMRPEEYSPLVQT